MCSDASTKAVVFSVFWLLAAACSGGPATDTRPVVSVTLDDATFHGLYQAGLDLEDAVRKIQGVGANAATNHIVEVSLRPDMDWDAQSYRLSSEAGRTRVEATHAIGAMYGLYQIIEDIGVLYLHPEETVLPTTLEAMPRYENKLEAPDFALRGFHEHTQHPIVMSDYLMRPDEAGFREGTSRYLQWLARNRQNYMSFHLLNTLSFDTWLPWISDIITEAHSLGVEVGVGLSFADQQQHCFKLLDDASPESVDDQIKAGLDRLLSAGFNHVVLQIGTSEFTRPETAEVLNWMNVATTYLADEYPEVHPWVWVHIDCDLHTEEGDLFFHTPTQADTRLGAFVHTTMFYTLTDPAPAYGCQTFRHQVDFMLSEDGRREQVFFPETAWWLGFDNNLPLMMPITGVSRQRDIERVLTDHQVMGHVTFTTGREWTYWQYDHYVARASWEGALSWSDYLGELQPLYGDAGVELLRNWTELQLQDFYGDNPMIYLYLAGELPQDELGAQIGIVARPVRPALKDIAGLNPEAFEAWRSGDFEQLQTMRQAYGALLETLEPGDTVWTRELHRTASLFVSRIDHALEIFGSIIDVREADEQRAQAHLDAARGITEDVIATVALAEDDTYRYPLEILARPKVASPTAYPFGYLWETSTGFFWSRRDDQLAVLIQDTFYPTEESWSTTPLARYRVTPEAISLVAPDDPVAQGILPSVLPVFLVAVTAWDADSGALSITLAQDVDQSGAPDPNTEGSWSCLLDDEGGFDATLLAYDVHAVDASQNSLGVLTVYDARLRTTPLDSEPPGLSTLLLEVAFDSQALMDLVRSIAGIDEEGLATLLKSAFDLPPSSELPARLPVTFQLDTTPDP